MFIAGKFFCAGFQIQKHSNNKRWQNQISEEDEEMVSTAFVNGVC